MNDREIATEFDELKTLPQELNDTGLYDIHTLISGIRHLLIENIFFYGNIMGRCPDKKPSHVFYDLKNKPKSHQLVYVQLGGGYAKEMRAPHWCYVYRINGPKLLVVPITSIKPESGPAREPYELDIIEGDGRTGRLHFDEMRSIDKM